MPNKLKVVVAIVLATVVGAIGYALLGGSSSHTGTSTDRQDTTQGTNVSEVTPESPKAPQPAQPVAQPGAYLDYSAQIVQNTKGKRILFFHAPWCPQCRELEASIKSGQIPEGTTIFKLDYDSNQSLRQQYGVTIQTTVVLLDDVQNGAKKYVAYDKPNLKTILENLQ